MADLEKRDLRIRIEICDNSSGLSHNVSCFFCSGTFPPQLQMARATYYGPDTLSPKESYRSGWVCPSCLCEGEPEEPASAIFTAINDKRMHLARVSVLWDCYAMSVIEMPLWRDIYHGAASNELLPLEHVPIDEVPLSLNDPTLETYLSILQEVPDEDAPGVLIAALVYLLNRCVVARRATADGDILRELVLRVQEAVGLDRRMSALMRRGLEPVKH